MTVQVYSVPGQRGEEGLLEWKSIDLYLLHVGLILTIASVHHPIPTQGNREHPYNFQNK